MAKKIIEKGIDVIGKGMDLADNMTTTLDEEADYINERYTKELESDSSLAKNIRPYFLIFVCLTYIALLLLQGTELLNVPSSVTSILELWGTVAVSFYFGGRSLEKVTKARRKDERILRRKKK